MATCKQVNTATTEKLYNFFTTESSRGSNKFNELNNPESTFSN